MTAQSTTTEQRYMFDADWKSEQRRLEALETIWDPFTFSNLKALRIPAGGSCLEVGAGNGSVAAWLCAAVGPSGNVVATDLDTRFLHSLYEPNLEIRKHDITQDNLEEGAYDLVHARLLLEHLPQHLEALDRMTAALKPGGWLLVEEFDHISFLPDPASSDEDRAAWDAWMDAFGILSGRRGSDMAYGRRLLGLLQLQGLVDITAEGRTVHERGGVPGRDMLLLSLLSLRNHLIETGAIDAAGVDRLVQRLSDPDFRWQSHVMVAAKGRKA